MTTIAEKVFERLKAGEKPSVVRASVSSSAKFADGLQMYLAWAFPRANRLHDEINEKTSVYDGLIGANQELEAKNAELRDEQTRMTNEVQEINRHHDILNRSYLDLGRKEKELRRSIQDLAGLRTLQDRLDRHGITIEGVDGFIAKSRRLHEKGFTLDIASLFAAELVKYGLEINNAASILANAISDSKSLSQKINDKRIELKRLSDETHTREALNEGLKTQHATLQQQVNGVKALLANEVGIYNEKKGQLEKQLDGIGSKIEAADAQRQSLLEEDANLASKNNAISNGLKAYTSNLEEIERTVAKNLDLATIALMISGQYENFDWKNVSRASYAFLNGFIHYLQSNRNVSVSYRTLVNYAMTIRNVLAGSARTNV